MTNGLFLHFLMRVRKKYSSLISEHTKKCIDRAGTGIFIPSLAEFFNKTPFFCPGIAPEPPPDILKYRKPYVLFERQGFFLFQLCPLPDKNRAAAGVNDV
jgi:hypothetical protein